MNPSESMLTDTKLVQQIMTARTERDAKSVLNLARDLGITGARPIGDREANAGTIEVASNPYYALAERVTNGLDAVLDLLAQQTGYFQIDDWPQPPPATPREAARILLNYPKGGVADLTDVERRELAKNVVVMLDESGIKQRPTVIIEDAGIGQHPLELPDGLLSLNRSNKLRKPWQHGSYGQGGSATLRFCLYTIVISRKAPELLLPDQADAVGWSVAYRDEGDPYKEALPVYKYLVGSSNEVPSFEPALLPDPDWHGTRVVHIGYDLTRYAQAYTQLTNGIWGMFQGLLFDPVFPFMIGGRRQIDLDAVKKGAVADDDMADVVVAATDSTRVVLGNRIRLDVGPRGDDPEVAWRGSDVRDLTKAHGRDLGRLRINYWVVRRPIDSTRKTDPTLGYVGKDAAVTMTLNGQRHEAQRRAWLKESLGFPYLAKNLIVQIDIDQLSPPARRELFSSTRERTVEGRMKDLIYDEAIEALAADHELRRLESEMRDRAMSKGAEEVAEGVRSKLEKFINTYLKGKTKKIKVPDKTSDLGPPPKPPGPPSPPRSTDDKHLPNTPSSIEFERDPIVITQGRRTTSWVHVNAKNGYLRRHEDDLTVSFSPNLGGKIIDIGKSELLAGKTMWTLQAEPDAPIVDGEIQAMLVTMNGIITATAKVRVIPPPKQTKRKLREKEVPVKGPNIVWVTRDEWDSEFNEKTVGQVNIGKDETDIRVNRHHPLIDKALSDKRLTEEQVKTRANRYLFAIGCGLFRQEYAMKEGSSSPDEEQVQAEQERMAETVLIAIDDRLIELES